MTKRYDFRGRTVVVTGASLGVGKACVEAFHEAGANVVLMARRLGPLEEAAAGLERSMILAVDVTDVGAVAAGFEAVVERFGGIDGLVNNAGMHVRGPLEDRTAEEVGMMVDVNLRAPLVLSRMVLPYLRALSDPRRKVGEVGGFIVNVASLAGKVPLDRAATYSATKFGLRAFTYAMAEEMRGTNVTVSVVSPGPIDTGFIMDEIDSVEDIVFSQTMCTADDVAEMILACAADGQVERAFPAAGAKVATLGYLFPSLRRTLKPLLSRKGRRVKERLRKERGN